MVASSIKTKTYLCLMEKQAHKAARRLLKTGKLTVVSWFTSKFTGEDRQQIKVSRFYY